MAHSAGIWTTIQDLINRLDTHRNEQREAVAHGRAAPLQVLRERDARLHALVDWKALGRASPVLADVSGKPRMSDYIPPIALAGVLAGGIPAVLGAPVALALAGGILVSLGIVAAKAPVLFKPWSNRFYVSLLHFDTLDAGADFPSVYISYVADNNRLACTEHRFRGIGNAGATLINLLDANRNPIGVLACGAPTPWAEVWGKPRISPRRLLKPGFADLLEQERQAIRALQAIDAQEADIGTTQVSCAALQQAFADLVLDPETEEAILRAGVLFAYGHRAAPRGILLQGPPGTGKSAVAAALARSLGVNFISAKVGDLKGENIGSSGNNVRRLWQDAREKAPTIIFLDECEGMLARRGAVQSDAYTNELVQTFLAEWEGLEERAQVLVIGATNRPDLLDDAVLSRFTDKRELRAPGARDHARLVAAVARQVRFSTRLDPELVRSMAGMAGREVRNVLEYALRKAAPDSPTTLHVFAAIREVRRKGADSADANARWNTLILPEDTKGWLKSWAAMIANVEELRARGIPFVRNVLLYGPPGTGKTQIARTLANEATVNFLAPTTSSIKGMYLGHGANNVAQFFAKARAAAPTILFIDEIDALATSRANDQDKLQAEILTQFLQEMDGLARQDGEVFVVAATNRIDTLDAAILQRFNHRLEVGLPALAEREAILRTLLAGRPVDPTLDFAWIAAATAGCAGRELKAVVEGAFHRAMSRAWATNNNHAAARVSQRDLVEALADRRVPA